MIWKKSKHKLTRIVTHTARSINPPVRGHGWEAPRGGGVVGGQNRISGYDSGPCHPPQRVHPQQMNHQQHEDFGNGGHYEQQGPPMHSGPNMGQRVGPNMGQRGGPSMGQRGCPSMGQRGGPSMGQRGGPSMGQRPGHGMMQRAGGGPIMAQRGVGGYRSIPYSRQQNMDESSYY